ncbi:MAG: DUF6421 family protein, partial [Microbacteriaceae bacterium]
MPEHISATIIGEPEVVERDETAGADPATDPSWLRLKQAVGSLRSYQMKDGSIPDPEHHPESRELVSTINAEILHLVRMFPHDEAYL